MAPLVSPLRYPGSKVELVDYIATVINENVLTGCHFYECHAGGASLGLALLARGAISKLTLIELDPLIYAFWKCVKSDPDELCDQVLKLEVSLDTWRGFQKFRSKEALNDFPILQVGLAGLFFNRTNFSGVLSAGPIGGMRQKSQYNIGCRFNKETVVKRIKSISERGKDLSVVREDAISYLRRYKQRLKSESLAYLDPPFYIQGSRLYRFHYSQRQHRRLARFICDQQFPWLVSYDRHPAIEKLFHGQTIVPIALNYVVKQSRQAEELLISNFPLPEPIYVGETPAKEDSCRAA